MNEHILIVAFSSSVPPGSPAPFLPPRLSPFRPSPLSGRFSSPSGSFSVFSPSALLLLFSSFLFPSLLSVSRLLSASLWSLGCFSGCLFLALLSSLRDGCFYFGPSALCGVLLCFSLSFYSSSFLFLHFFCSCAAYLPLLFFLRFFSCFPFFDFAAFLFV